MSDSTWIRAYNDKNIYTADTLRCGTTETRYIKGTQGGGQCEFRLTSLMMVTLYISA